MPRAGCFHFRVGVKCVGSTEVQVPTALAPYSFGMDIRFNSPPASAARTLLVLAAVFAVFFALMLATRPPAPKHCGEQGADPRTCILERF